MKKLCISMMTAIILYACSSISNPSTTPTTNPFALAGFTLTSGAFENGKTIPIIYSCKGENISPEFSWEGAPPGTESFALTLEDPDARGFVHWLIWNIPADTNTIPEKSLPEGAVQGTTSFNKTGYGGPCPPSGVHHYTFKLYALDTMLELKEGARLKDLQAAIQNHILAESEMTGMFPSQ
jgi:Raf kinase inhibitor-like YbhB/YbcL family protein